jgi:hypothetical protein
VQPKPSGVANTEFVAPTSTPETNPEPEINIPLELGRAGLSAVPVVGPVISAGEAIAG